MIPFCQRDLFFYFPARPGLLHYLDRKCIVLPARCCGAGSCSAFPFNTRPLILQPSSLLRSFVRLWHVPLHRLGGVKERDPGGAFLPLVTDESPGRVCAALNRQTRSRSVSTLSACVSERREEAMSNGGRHGQKGNTPNSSYTSSSTDRDQLCLFFNKSAARLLRAVRRMINATLSDKIRLPPSLSN